MSPTGSEGLGGSFVARLRDIPAVAEPEILDRKVRGSDDLEAGGFPSSKLCTSRKWAKCLS